MNLAFIIALGIFIILEILLIRAFIIRKSVLATKSTSISLGLFLLLLASDYILRFNIPYFPYLLSMAALIIHSYLGFYLNLYNKSKSFDRWMHVYGTFSISLLIYAFINAVAVGARLYRALFIGFLGVSLGAFYEVLEYLTDTKHEVKLQRGLKDTNFDIISNIFGACAAALFAYFALI